MGDLKNKIMKNIDVIIILGGGVNKQGVISKITQERLDGFLEKKNKFLGIPILLSGRWSVLAKNELKITEAQAMKKYLVVKGINPARIYLEIKSFDTMSNAIFSKKIIKKHKNWKNILLVTSRWHIKRAAWIFKKVFGKSYHIHLFPVISQDNNQRMRDIHENRLLSVAKKILNKFEATKRGTNKALRKIHQFYSHGKTVKKLFKKVINRRKRLSS